MDNLYNILWAYRMIPRTPIGETPFKLTFGTKAVIPLDIERPFLRTEHYNQQKKWSSSLSEPRPPWKRERISLSAHGFLPAKSSLVRVKGKASKVGDLVLRRTEASQPTEVGKLSLRWEGSYQVVRIVRPEAYQLQRLDNSIASQTWNLENLRKYYQ